MNKGTFVKGEKRPGQGKRGPDKINKDVKAMILEALESAGGASYLLERANDPKTATAFMALVGRILPKEIKADIAATHVIGKLTEDQQRAIAEAILAK